LRANHFKGVRPVPAAPATRVHARAYPQPLRPERIEHLRARPPQRPRPCAQTANCRAGSPIRPAAAQPGALCRLPRRFRPAVPPSPARFKCAADPTAPGCPLPTKQSPSRVQKEVSEISRIVGDGPRRYTAQTGRLRPARRSARRSGRLTIRRRWRLTSSSWKLHESAGHG